MKHLRCLILLLLISNTVFSQNSPKVEPPFWWTGMMEKEVQLLVHAKGISFCSPRLIYPGVELIRVNKVDNPDYLFLDLRITEKAESGTFRIDFDRDENVQYSYEYQLLQRETGSAEREGFGPEDVIYLIMPDRFANGDPYNDDHPGMTEKADRSNHDGRHGGDIAGISTQLQYIRDLGVTALWLNPVLENNNPKYSYHGYAITDFYKVDARIGTNEEYLHLVNKCHKNDIKMIMDMVFNHCGHGHWWMESLPSEDWVHQWPEFTRSNFRAPVISDPYATDYDKVKMQNGWFDTNMPDLNQQNEYLANYLIQNSIWWVEFARLDGIRMDTYPYSDQAFMKRWMKRMQYEYPEFNILGETWLQKEAITSYYAGSDNERYGYNSYVPNVTDFPVHYAIEKAFHEEESWTEGMARLYYVLAQDFLYDNPNNNVVFADNHDLSRFYSVMKHDLRKFKMGMAFTLTTRGIPMIYYGTEILMEGEEPWGHGFIRQDFPGGWNNDSINAFTGAGLNDEQVEASEYVKNLLHWRKTSKASQIGKLTHFIPEEGVYVYFRIHEDEIIMVVLNNNEDEMKMPDLERFDECLLGKRKAYDIINNEKVSDVQNVLLEPKSVRILDIK